MPIIIIECKKTNNNIKSSMKGNSFKIILSRLHDYLKKDLIPGLDST